MFAVPGWSVSAQTLKAETAQPENAPAAAKSKKRKRGGASATETAVTPSNVADLYETVFEGKKDSSHVKKDKADAKRQKKNSQGKAESAKADSDDVTGTPAKKQKKGEADSEVKNGAVQESERKKQKKQRKKQKENGVDNQASRHPAADAKVESSASTAKPTAVTAARPATAPKPVALTALQASMREKLVSARFRYLNETLYTQPSAEAFGLFQESPEMFDEYHEGFRRQVKVWPENPVDSFLGDIRARAKAKPPARGRPGAPPLQRSKVPLPRTAGSCIIADLGCGDARLAESLKADSSKLRVEIKSFDLQSPSPLVIKADIANLPLEDGSVNVAIFCLALMGTNWIDFIEEAYRILHWKGELWVAEIKSRFGPVRNKNAPVNHSVGHRKKVAAKKGKPASEQQAGHEEDLTVEVDGADDRRRATDVSAFVDALQKRGFVLQGEREEAVDMSNKMFVKMHFTKGASPTRGKGAKPQEGLAKGKKGFAPKWDEAGEDETSQVNEAAILKPCLYKIR
ncbi:ribosomal RNA-processing protein 8 [Drechmeria coniospora]|uniref:Ribosomal RNA-processing protein 8 n=1 Tax=Drechmeria coniospora TaxID=98403 RepID=A0A151GQQ4_DRECN|nr:ribosomal RNA-processing protein 8 [Drechmeria coniospora]KYK59423.1 ribosomal RNA-processing protein 8 [Drechmeria coniospora]